MGRWCCLALCVALSLGLDVRPRYASQPAAAHNVAPKPRNVDRRVFGGVASATLASLSHVPTASAAADRMLAAPTAEAPVSDAANLRDGLQRIEALVEDWDAATLNCRFAEVNRDLLQSENKDELLKEATKNALMSKNAKAIKTLCKRDPEAVRLILGLDSTLNKKSSVPSMFDERTRAEKAEPKKSPLVGADRMIRRARNTVDDDDLVDYVDAEEAWLSAMAQLQSASYASGVADFGAIVSTAASNGDAKDSAFLNDAKLATIKARDALRLIVKLLPV